MSQRWVGLHVTGDLVVLVDLDVPADDNEAAVVQSDTTIRLERGDRADAYQTMYRAVSDYLRQNKVKRVVIKASAVNPSGTGGSHLLAAELRGVVAAASVDGGAQVMFIKKQSLSKTFGKRKADEYVKDAAFWKAEIAGNLRSGSREAALLVLAAAGRGGRDGD